MYYDRILVMDAGKVAEFDPPLTLFDQEDSIFRSLCNEAGLTRANILRIRSGEDALAVLKTGHKADIWFSTIRDISIFLMIYK